MAKKIKKYPFYKNKKINNMEDIDGNKILVSNKESYAIRIHLNTLLHIMIIILFDHYV